MKEKGQVFTTDMVFALLLMAALVSVSGQAYEIATGKIRSYSTHYSLERVANDTADVLVNTPGRPTDWETNPENLETLGLAKTAGDNLIIKNFIDFHKVSGFIKEITEDNWKPNKENSDRAIMEFFGLNDFVENFEIRIMENGEILWDFWPGKDPGENSPAENALEIATVNRVVYGTPVYVAGESPPLIRAEGKFEENLKFRIYPGELEGYDWYVHVENIEPVSNPNIELWINSMPNGTSDYGPILGKHLPATRPESSGGIEGDVGKLTENQGEQPNFIGVKLTGVPKEKVKIYVIAIPTETSWKNITQLMGEDLLNLQVRVWR